MSSDGDRFPPGSAPACPGLLPARSASGDMADVGQDPPSPDGKKVSGICSPPPELSTGELLPGGRE